MSYNQEELKFVSLEERDRHGSIMFYIGAVLGGLGMLIFGFLSLWILGAYV